MNQTVVGVFNSHEAAERAAETLASQGFERSQMHIKSTGGSSTGTITGSSSASGDDEGTGIMASIRHFFSELFGDEDEQSGHYAEAVRRGGAVLAVEADDDRLDLARDALMQAGAVDIEEQVSNWRSQGWSGHDASAAPYSAEQAAAERQNLVSGERQDVAATGDRQNVLPVVQEELEVGKRQVSGGAVRVVSRVVSRPVSESVELRREEAAVERRAVDRPATEADLAAMQERTIEVTEMAERPVVSKTARVVEEVVVGKQVSSETQVIEETVRRTEVEVERIGGDDSRGGGRERRSSGGGGAAGGVMDDGGVADGVGRQQIGATQVTPAGAMGSSGAGGSAAGSMAGMAMGGAAGSSRRNFADLEDEFRQDYQANFASSGVSYEDVQPAYRGGYELRGDSRFADSDWDTAEPQLRQHWESEHPGSAWERVKAAFRRGWDRATS